MMSDAEIDVNRLLSQPVRFPSETTKRRFERLIQPPELIAQLAGDLHFLFTPMAAKKWAKNHHSSGLDRLIGLLDDIVPLIIFEGDAGTGKTALAETIGDVVARERKYDVQLVKMSTQVRGTGYVGQMGTALTMAFEHAIQLWQKRNDPLLLLIDEADSILTSRASADHHHEDKSGVNTVLQQLDIVKESPAQVAVIAITNRVGVLDPAVLRRATVVHRFVRPSSTQREKLFQDVLREVHVPSSLLKELVDASQPKPRGGGEPISFSWSDLTLRCLVPVVRDAVSRNVPLEPTAILQQLKQMVPSPKIEE